MSVVVIKKRLPYTRFRLIKVICIENIEITQKIEFRGFFPGISFLGMASGIKESWNNYESDHQRIKTISVDIPVHQYTVQWYLRLFHIYPHGS